MKRLTASAAALALLLPVAAAGQSVPTEVFRPGAGVVTLYLHPFLTAEETAILRQIAASPDALVTLLGQTGGHAAIAVSPDEGFLRDGTPAHSAKALAQLPDLESARRAAIDACESVSEGTAPCVTVVEVVPAR